MDKERVSCKSCFIPRLKASQMKCTISTVVGLGTLLVGVILMFSQAGNAAHEDNGCFNTVSIRVSLGDQIFEIPRSYRPFISPIVDKGFERNKICQSAEDPPIAANRLALNFSGKRALIDDRTRALEGVQIFVSSGTRSHQASKRRLDRKLGVVQEAGQVVRDLPVIGGFHAFPTDVQYPSLYFSDEAQLTSPDGYLVVFSCAGAEVWAPWDHRFGLCSTLYTWTDKIAISYRIWRGSHKLEDFPKVDEAVRRFVMDIGVAG